MQQTAIKNKYTVLQVLDYGHRIVHAMIGWHKLLSFLIMFIGYSSCHKGPQQKGSVDFLSPLYGCRMAFDAIVNWCVDLLSFPLWSCVIGRLMNNSIYIYGSPLWFTDTSLMWEYNGVHEKKVQLNYGNNNYQACNKIWLFNKIVLVLTN